MNREALRKRLLATFREEAAEHIQTLETEIRPLLADAQTPGTGARLETLFRVMHTLKGAARSVRLVAIESVCQTNEEILRGIVQSARPPDAAQIAQIQDSIVQLRRLIRESDAAPVLNVPPVSAAPESAPAFVPPAVPVAPPPHEQSPVAAPPSAVSAAAPPTMPETGVDAAVPVPSPVPGARVTQSVRVGIDQLDRIMSDVEELILPSLVGAERAREIRRLGDLIGGLRLTAGRQMRRGSAGQTGSGPASAGQTSAGRNDRKEMLNALRDAESRSRRLAAAVADDQRVLRAGTAALFREIQLTRMQPASAMFEALPEMVREICEATGKQAKLRIRGDAVALDRKVIEAAKNPLLHIVRNAIDHGIEAPAARLAAGKRPRGRLAIAVSPIDGGRIAIEISDDGCGMDLTALRDAALRARVAPKAVLDALADREVVALAFRSGISTRAMISKLSGMGMGLAIVQEEIERIDGRVDVESSPGRGTKFRLEIPASVASFTGLLVEAGGARYLWPGDSVVRAIGIPPAEAAAAATAGRIVFDGAVIPFRRLSALLGIDSAAVAHERSVPCVVVSAGGRRAALAVDAVLGSIEVLAKDFPAPLKRVRHISTAGLLPTGGLALVLRPGDIVASARFGRHAVQRETFVEMRERRRILVVDDSITTRTMERNLLESVGYAVEVAADGLAAWAHLQEKPVDLVLSDVDMPGMTGFELTSRIRADSKLADLPVILVTAMERRDDRDRGIKIGANAYVLKSAFDQSNLLDIVRRLI